MPTCTACYISAEQFKKRRYINAIWLLRDIKGMSELLQIRDTVRKMRFGAKTLTGSGGSHYSQEGNQSSQDAALGMGITTKQGASWGRDMRMEQHEEDREMCIENGTEP